MKKFISTVSTTIKAFQLLSNPEVQSFISKNIPQPQNTKYPSTSLPSTQLRVGRASQIQTTTKLGRGDIYFHKYFMVQVVN